MHQSPTTLTRPPLHAVHVELGARFTGFAGWSMPLRYSSEAAEHRAVRERAGLFDLSHMGQIEVCGPLAPAVLDHALVGLTAAGRRVPRSGDPVVRLSEAAEPEQVGVVTSGAPSPTLHRPIAMARLRADAAQVPARLGVQVRGHTEPVEIAPLPFYRRPR
ncbi:glycine cleavage T C-terminal barrel domain-containing protein [Micromonospora sp. NBC_01412]|uniref:glycine cleavage T C-terminal barrel domain-containing protein n=1 Tax=Micromonospora sp. NBC_01412 TaxID=2903590 RepID=UPI003248B922